MIQNLTATVIESRLLIREALVSLLKSHSYQVVGSVASMAGEDNSLLLADAPRLVILGSLPIGEVVGTASRIRSLWPRSKICFLFDHLSPADIHELLASEIDGCIPVLASTVTLLETLQTIIAADFRVLILKTGMCLSAPCAVASQVEGQELSPAPNSQLQGSGSIGGAADHDAVPRGSWGLSVREGEVLKSVAKGYSNKMIARACGVTDATVKVHMKSILRKIRRENRTQAAVWALEQGYGTEIGALAAPAMLMAVEGKAGLA